jgi:hypothetical protein
VYVRVQRSYCHHYQAVLRQGIASTSPSSSQQLPDPPVPHWSAQQQKSHLWLLSGPCLVCFSLSMCHPSVERLRGEEGLLLRSAAGEGVWETAVACGRAALGWSSLLTVR